MKREREASNGKRGLSTKRTYLSPFTNGNRVLSHPSRPILNRMFGHSHCLRAMSFFFASTNNYQQQPRPLGDAAVLCVCGGGVA
jgi:hypothetical protein